MNRFSGRFVLASVKLSPQSTRQALKRPWGCEARYHTFSKNVSADYRYSELHIFGLFRRVPRDSSPTRRLICNVNAASMPVRFYGLRSGNCLSICDAPLDPASHHGIPLRIRKISMVWQTHLLAVGVFLDVNKVLWIFEAHLHEAALVRNVPPLASSSLFHVYYVSLGQRYFHWKIESCCRERETPSFNQGSCF